MHTFKACVDCKVEAKRFVYIFEFKWDVSTEAGLAQIDSREYVLTFATDHRKLYKIGVFFDSKE